MQNNTCTIPSFQARTYTIHGRASDPGEYQETWKIILHFTMSMAKQSLEDSGKMAMIECLADFNMCDLSGKMRIISARLTARMGRQATG
jgi:hypothetical protein